MPIVYDYPPSSYVVLNPLLCSYNITGAPAVVAGFDQLTERSCDWTGSYDPLVQPDVVLTLSGTKYKNNSMFGPSSSRIVSGISSRATLRYLLLQGTTILQGTSAGSTTVYENMVTSSDCCNQYMGSVDVNYVKGVGPTVSYSYSGFTAALQLANVYVLGPVYSTIDVTGLQIKLTATGVANGPWEVEFVNQTLSIYNSSGLYLQFNAGTTLNSAKNSIDANANFDCLVGSGVFGTVATISDLLPFAKKFLYSSTSIACLLIVEKFERISDQGRLIGEGKSVVLPGGGFGPPLPAVSGSSTSGLNDIFFYNATNQSMSFDDLVKTTVYFGGTYNWTPPTGVSYIAPSCAVFRETSPGGYISNWSTTPSNPQLTINNTIEWTYTQETSQQICASCGDLSTFTTCGLSGDGICGEAGCAGTALECFDTPGFTTTITTTLTGQLLDLCDCGGPSSPPQCSQPNARTEITIQGCNGGIITMSGTAIGGAASLECSDPPGPIIYSASECLDAGYVVRCVSTFEEITVTQSQTINWANTGSVRFS